MKQDIHPQYFKQAKIHCSCGNVITVGATKESLQIETCSACHPFFTGKERNLETVGRVQKFKERMDRAAKAKTPSAKPGSTKKPSAKKSKKEGA